jgi:hypothetical protein
MTTETDKLKAIINAVKAYPYIPRGLLELIEQMEKTP